MQTFIFVLSRICEKAAVLWSSLYTSVLDSVQKIELHSSYVDFFYNFFLQRKNSQA